MKKTLIAGLLGCMLGVPAFAANIVLNNVDPAGVGFNDPSPRSPVGGNSGTTLGQQRLIAYQKALELWGKTLTSKVTIVVQGSFAPLSCTPTGGVLAQAGPLQIWSDVPGAPLPGHWYGGALANAIAGQDLSPGPFDPPGVELNDDIVAFFNGSIGTPGCIAGSTWYYGLDDAAPPGTVDFLDTFMHEVGHGLGFLNFVDGRDGLLIEGLPDVFMAHTLDLDVGLWDTMSPAQIVTSSLNNGRVVWAGANVTANAPTWLGPSAGVKVTGTLSKQLDFGTASFGPIADKNNFKGPIVLANDGVGTVTDGCEAISNVAGKVALIDRGVCTFAVKAKNAQVGGATAVIIANTLGRGSFGMTGADPTITIPSIGISNADGDAIKAKLPGVNALYFVDATNLAGTTSGFVRLYAPTTYAPGSSISHFDTPAFPDLLMEPFSTPNSVASRSTDLTPSLMQDIGWKLETLKIGSCDTGVTTILRNGTMLHALVDDCSQTSGSQAQFQACVKNITKSVQAAHYINGSQASAIMRCVGGSAF